MRAVIETHFGKVEFDSPKIADDICIQDQPKKEQQALSNKLFPLDENDIDVIIFIPRKPEFDTQEYHELVIVYLKKEGFVKDEGNYRIVVGLPELLLA